MHAGDLIELHPQLYHMAEAGSWPMIQRHGLLTTFQLVELFECTEQEREAILFRPRDRPWRLTHAVHGSVVIRDQKVLSEGKLRDCLVDMTPRQWCETINRRVFLWPSRERVLELLAAKEYRGRVHTVLTIDTARLVDRHRGRLELSAINSGATLYKPQPRGTTTFRSLTAFPFHQIARKRSREKAIAEVTVVDGIQDITALIQRVECMQDGRTIEDCPLENAG